MNIDSIKSVELEITSNCNAACPGCARTLNSDILEVTSFSFNDLIRLFPSKEYIEGKRFKFCGVLGDPLIHTEFIDMAEYLVANGCKKLNVSTNAGIGTKDTWLRLGKLAYNNKAVVIDFCIDGHSETNHIYRVNTKWNVIERNLNAFVSKAKHMSSNSCWSYIVFDHNEYEIDKAVSHAKKLGLEFAKRTGMRNSYYNWIAKIGKKNAKQEKIITTTGDKEHKDKDKVLQLEKIITEKKVNADILKTIKCKYVHQNEIFIGADLTMWPCCFLYDSKFKNLENINGKLSKYFTNWNSLIDKSINQVLQHPYYQGVLEDSWNPSHELHMMRCIKTCGYNQAYHNKKEFV